MRGQVFEFLLRSQSDTHQFGMKLGRSLPPGTVLLLNGDLGSGKTTLVQGIGAGLGITDAIASPTFTLINEYLEGRIPLYHFDLYRLEAGAIAELHPELYWDAIDCPAGIVAIEWSDRLPYLPESYIEITLTPTESEGRLLKMVPVGQVNVDL